MTTPDDLAARYGHTPSAARRTRWVVVSVAIAFVIVFVAWVVWGGLFQAPAQFESRDTGYTIISDSQVSVDWQLSVEPGAESKCAVQALNSTFGIVGWKVVDVPASEERTRVFTEAVRTSELAVTGLIYQCWLT